MVVGGGFAAVMLTLLALASRTPAFYAERKNAADPARRRQQSRDFLSRGTRLISDIENASNWSADFDEEQINAWLAEDFQSNHAEQSLPAGVGNPRIALEGDLLRIGYTYRFGPLRTVIQIGVRAWVPKRNLLAVEFEGAWAGALPLSTNHLRHVIEQFANANNLNVTWKRHDRRLVALVEFPRGHREVVLHRVEIGTGRLQIRGGASRPNLPSIDYAPSAN